MRAFSLRFAGPAAAFLALPEAGVWYGSGEAPGWARDGGRVRVCGVTRGGRVYRTGRLAADDAACACCVGWRVLFG